MRQIDRTLSVFLQLSYELRGIFCLEYVVDSDGKQNKIFVIDDDSSIGDILVIMLSGENYIVRVFTVGKQAVDSAKKERPDLVLLDYFLPGENAENIVRQLKEILGNKLPVILMSASFQAKQKGKEMPINEFISKPFQRESLLSAIQRNIS